MKKIWNWICSLLTKERVSSVWRILFNGAVTAVVSVLTNEKLMDAAFQISLSLLGLREGASTKKVMFNALMLEWCEANNVGTLSEADLNAVREIAYAAVRSREAGIKNKP